MTYAGHHRGKRLAEVVRRRTGERGRITDVNLKIVKTLGFTMPLSLLDRADEVIE